MIDEKYELQKELYWEEFMEYRFAWCDAVLERHGLNLFDLYAVNEDGAKEAVCGGLMFSEWLDARPREANPKRL
jgi:hypothetical protein